MEHTYPADWVFLSPDQSVNYTCGADAPLAVDVILDILDGRAGPHRFFAGGTEIIEAAFKADTLLGPNFEGKPHSAYLSQLIIPTFRLKAMTQLSAYRRLAVPCIKQYLRFRKASHPCMS
jgi:hypothetical protein